MMMGYSFSILTGTLVVLVISRRHENGTIIQGEYEGHRGHLAYCMHGGASWHPCWVGFRVYREGGERPMRVC